jgi:toxin ParE1/3/4
VKIHLTKLAVDDLQEIKNFIHLDNPVGATQVVLRVLDAIEYLASYPTMGRAGRVHKTRELIISNTPFIVIYQIRQQTITVLRILHTSRKWSN